MLIQNAFLFQWYYTNEYDYLTNRNVLVKMLFMDNTTYYESRDLQNAVKSFSIHLYGILEETITITCNTSIFVLLSSIQFKISTDRLNDRDDVRNLKCCRPMAST